MQSADLDELITVLDDTVTSAVAFHAKWQPVWDQIKTIGSSFKQTRYPTASEKQEAWNRFQSLVDRVKDIQSQERDHRQQFARHSEQHKNEILTFAEAAKPPSAFAEMIFALVTLPAQPVKWALDALTGSGLDETLETLRHCSNKLSEGWQLLSECKHEMLGQHKKEAFEALTASRCTSWV